MKKIFVIMIALFLAIPAISYAGSATSRWDLTIGGDVKFDVGWSSTPSGDLQATQPIFRPTIQGSSVYNANDTKYGDMLWGGGETGLNLFVKGPDAWGAKTSAFILADFTGVWGNNAANNYGTFNLLIAEMHLDWANTSLKIGQGGSFWGFPMTFANSNAWNAFGGGKGAAPIYDQITLTERLGKNFSILASVFQNTNFYSGQNTFTFANQQTAYTRADIPAFALGLDYASDSCGKIGPWKLDFQLAGFYGQAKFLPSDFSVLTGQSNQQYWYGEFKWVVPIIPEKNSNKGGALLFDGNVYTGQVPAGAGWAAAISDLSPGFYARSNGDIADPVMTGVYGHAQYWFVDAVSFNAFYNYNAVKQSALQGSIVTGAPSSPDLALSGGKNESNYIANIMYEVNPAIRLTFEYDKTVENFYAASVAGFKNSLDINVYRMSMYYFF